MLRKLFLSLLLVGTMFPTQAAPPKPASFGVAAHGNVAIEWWYVNAHVTTDKGRHLAVMGSFFRFGNGVSYLNPFEAAPRAHYLIYEVTDLDRKTQRPYSLADKNMVALLGQMVPLLAGANPNDKGARALLAALKQGRLPAPHQEISGRARVVNAPFRLAYGASNTLASDNAANTAFTLDLDAGRRDKIHLTLASQKPPMAVGGRGETGLTRPTDMYYYSLTRCQVRGTVDTGAGPEKVTDGQGWFDHQWGNSWVAQNDGWDWWGVQLEDGTDILFFRQRDLSTGKVFFPLATFMDAQGNQTVTKNIIFKPDPKALWKSPRSGVTYPLGWTVTFPDKSLQLHITAAVQSQEMPILGPGGGIWEGACRVSAAPYHVVFPDGHVRVPRPSHGVAYMELVGYNSSAVRAQMARKK
ncbi:MAG: hypothetical protein JO250_20210 [Armatimonadetes bacterium]|nr:hypothetical protein [Armatimonadota bacterium]